MEKAFTREMFEKASIRILRNGRFSNAIVYQVTIGGTKWTVKDFSQRPWYIRNTVALFLLKREIKALKRLKGVAGVTQQAFAIDRHAIALEFLEGRSLDKVEKEEISVEFLENLETLFHSIHDRGVVHLDARGTGNIMITPQGKPALIDFQSALMTDWMPKWLKTIVVDIDFSAALKKWKIYHPDEMGEARTKELIRINGIRRYWIFKGYFGLKKKKKQK